MTDAQFYALLSRAIPSASLYEQRWHIDLVEAWSLIHAAGILDGCVYVWPDARLSKTGRHLLRVQSLREKFQRGEWRLKTDL